MEMDMHVYVEVEFTHENTSERTILHLVNKIFWGANKVWLLALQKRLATPLKIKYKR
jgi:hypothetical protein